MKSPRGFAAAAVFLLALPVTLLYQAVIGSGTEIVVHAALALGAALMASAVFDFRTRRWISWCGSVSIGVLAVIFFIQCLSELTKHATLTQLSYQLLGQHIENVLGNLFLMWCVVVLLVDSQGKTKALGFVALSATVCMEAYAIGLNFLGSSLDAEAPILKVLALLPFAWLLFESWKPPRIAQPVSAVTGG